MFSFPYTLQFLSGLDEGQSPGSSPFHHQAASNAVVSSDDELPDICQRKLKPVKTAYTSNHKKSPKTSAKTSRSSYQTEITRPRGSSPRRTIPAAGSSSSDENLGRVDRWLQQSQFSRINQSHDELPPLEVSSNRKAVSLETDKDLLQDRINANHRKVQNQNIKYDRTRRISISSSDNDDDKVTTDHNFHKNIKDIKKSDTDSDLRLNMQRPCSPISISDSDDDEQLVTLSLKQRIQGHTNSVQEDEGSQSTMYSTACDTESMESQQTVNTYSSVETADSQQPGKKKRRKRTAEEIEQSKRQAQVIV